MVCLDKIIIKVITLNRTTVALPQPRYFGSNAGEITPALFFQPQPTASHMMDCGALLCIVHVHWCAIPSEQEHTNST